MVKSGLSISWGNKVLLVTVAVMTLALVFTLGSLVGSVIRSSTKEGRAEQCVVNLRRISEAKGSWAGEHDRGLMTEDPLTRTDLHAYFDTHMWRKCPSGGIYTIGKVGEPPTCTIKGHSLAPEL